MHTVNISDLSILLIEPSATQLKVIVKHLAEEGIHNIDGVSSGAEALAVMGLYQPDLVITSMYLPDTTATELIEKIKRSDEYNEIPVMLISSETNTVLLDAIRQSGVVAILPKPFNHEDLKRALRATIEFIDPQELELKFYNIENIRVLVVDDSMLARKHIIRVLENLGIIQITEAKDGKEALEIFSQSEEAFDLILTDYNMPEMDGQELTQYIRQHLNNPFIPILMVTSEQNQARLSNIEKAGVSAVFDKPFEPQIVKEMLFRVLDEN